MSLSQLIMTASPCHWRLFHWQPSVRSGSVARRQGVGGGRANRAGKQGQDQCRKWTGGDLCLAELSVLTGACVRFWVASRRSASPTGLACVILLLLERQRPAVASSPAPTLVLLLPLLPALALAAPRVPARLRVLVLVLLVLVLPLLPPLRPPLLLLLLLGPRSWRERLRLAAHPERVVVHPAAVQHVHLPGSSPRHRSRPAGAGMRAQEGPRGVWAA